MQLDVLDIKDMYDSRNVITNPEPLDKDNNFTIDGLYSEKIFGKLNGNDIDYSCFCGEISGRFSEGLHCPKCDTKVGAQDSYIRRLGWINLHGYKVISPYFYNIITRIITNSQIKKIVTFTRKININGNPEEEMGENYESAGYQYFIENLEKILTNYADTPVKKSYLAFLKENWKFVLHDAIPVCSTKLRPAMIANGEIHFDKMNNDYNRIIATSNALAELKSSEESILTLNPFLCTIQEFYCAIHEKLVVSISGKGGWIRSNLLSNRLNFTGRNVISPLECHHDVDEIHLPYITCMELFKFHIINILTRRKKITYAEAHSRWHSGLLKFNREFHTIIQELIEAEKDRNGEPGYKVIINRNPTISRSSLLLVRLTKCKEDISDLTMSISNSILKYIAGDFDGDVLNIFMLLDQQSKEYFKYATPTDNIISTDNGEFNYFAMLDKDYMLGLHSLCHN